MTLPVTINGTRYPSISAAAKALGVSMSSMFKAYHRGHPELAGKMVGKTKAQSVTVNGVRYRSFNAAAKAVGWHRETIAKLKHRHGDNLTLRPRGRAA